MSKRGVGAELLLAEVEAAGQLAHEHEVRAVDERRAQRRARGERDRRGSAGCSRRGRARCAARTAPPQAAGRRRPRAPRRPPRRSRIASCCRATSIRSGSYGAPTSRERGQADRALGVLEAGVDGVEHGARRGDHLGADAVAGQEENAAHRAVPALRCIAQTSASLVIITRSEARPRRDLKASTRSAPAASPWPRCTNRGSRMTGALLLDLLDGGAGRARRCSPRATRTGSRTRGSPPSSTSSPTGSRRSGSSAATASRSRSRPGRSSSSCCSRSRRSAPRPRRSTRPTARAEFAFYLDDLQPRALLVPAGELDAAREAARDADAPRRRDARAGRPARAPAGRTTAGAARTAPAPDDVALLLHTSGTTSRPKQVPLRHRNLIASARAIARHYALSADDVSYCAMPLFHVHGLVASTLAQLAAGGTVLAPRRVAPAPLLVAARRARRDLVLGEPDAAPDGARARARASGPTACACASRARAARRSRPSWSPASRRTSTRPLLEAYGMTEASHEMAANPLPPAAPGLRLGRRPDRRRDPHRRQAGPRRRRGERRGRDPRARRHGRLPRERRGERRGVRRRLVPHRRQGPLRRRLPRARRAAQGDHHPRRREHLPARGRGRAAAASVRLRGRRLRRARREVRPARRRARSSRPAELSEADVVAHCREHLAAFKVPSVVHIVDTHPAARPPARCSGRACRRTSARTDEVRDPRRRRDRLVRRRGARARRRRRRADRARRAARGAAAPTACACSRRAATSRRSRPRPTTSRRSPAPTSS